MGYINVNTASDMLMEAWGVIANAGDGNWKRESLSWREAAAQWREKWLKFNSMWCKKYAQETTCIQHSLRKQKLFPEGTVDLLTEFKIWCGNCQTLSDALFGSDEVDIDPNTPLEEVKKMFPCEKV